MTKLAWVLPVIALGLLIDAGARWNFYVPLPYFFLACSVGFAGLLGGQRSGFLAGLFAGLFLLLGYFEQYGPVTLTGSISVVFIAWFLFTFAGIGFGRIKEQRDASIEALRSSELRLETSLNEALAKNAAQTEKVIKSEARLSSAIRITGLGNFSFDPITGKCNYCSQQHAANLGMTPDEFIEIASGHNEELLYVHDDDRHIVWEAIEKINSGEAQTFEYRVLFPDGEIRHIREFEEPVFDENRKIIESMGTSLDLTELRVAEARARQSQRIEAIGTLTGGVAHDFNNLLAIILGNLELSLEADDEVYRTELIQNSVEATLRGAGLTRNLLSFARRAHLQPKRMNLNQTIQNTMAWGARVLPETISIENFLMAGLWSVDLDEVSIENALINILLNARDAMPNGGKVTIETANMRIGDEYLSERDVDIEPGCYVMLVISDTGHGIPSDQLEKVFEPFYTEKPVGEGSGLGLSMVQGFIKQSGGAIRMYSEVDVGTTLKLYFKAVEPEADRPQSQVREQLHSAKTHAKILVAEDEEGVRRVLERVLGDARYAVTTTKSGDEAFEVFNSGGKFDLLLTDIVMPGKLQGPELAKSIRATDAHIPCIFLSGYAIKATVRDCGLMPTDIRLMKPVSRQDLLAAVSKALEPTNSKDKGSYCQVVGGV